MSSVSIEAEQRRKSIRMHDVTLIILMGVLAACGLIYEYLLSHYAGRIVGAVETTIFAMIGVMIVSMGIGSFYAKYIKCAFTGLATLEVTIGLLGSISVLIMAFIFSAAYALPTALQDIYGLDPAIVAHGGVVDALNSIAQSAPFVCGFVLGFMIGMEIPLIARIREQLHGEHLEHNMGTVYGADYIGAGIGAALWVLVCLKLPIMYAAIGTAAINLSAGVVFLWRYQSHIKMAALLWIGHGALALVLVVLSVSGQSWLQGMNNILFKDRVTYSLATPFQQLTVTERIVGQGLPSVTSLFINGRLQFSSSDEAIYHSMLTYPALLASARTDQVLVIGGGDGMAVRDILKWNPDKITLIDLDPGMVNLFSGRDSQASREVSERLLKLNKSAFSDKRVEFIYGDALLEVEKLISKGNIYDCIIVDLPDPNHPDLNNLYSDYFYAKLRELLSGDGAIAIQSGSAYHSQKAFISIGKTVSHAGLKVEQYHTNVPTFGEWGWTIAVKRGRLASHRIREVQSLPVQDRWISKEQMLAAFVFSPIFYDEAEDIKTNEMGSHVIYQYHSDGWKKERGIFYAGKG